MSLEAACLSFDHRSPRVLVFSTFDSNKGFTVTNNTVQNVYVEDTDNSFEKVPAGKTSKAYKSDGDYNVRVNDEQDAKVYLSITVDAANGDFKVAAGTQRGKFAVNCNYA